MSRHTIRSIINDIYSLSPGLPKLSIQDLNLLTEALDPDQVVNPLLDLSNLIRHQDYRICIDSFLYLWRLWLRKVCFRQSASHLPATVAEWSPQVCLDCG